MTEKPRRPPLTTSSLGLLHRGGPLPQRVQRDLGAVRKPALGQDTADVGAHRVLTDEQPVPNLLVGESLDHSAKNLSLALRERLFHQRQIASSLDLAHKLAGNGRVHGGLALADVVEHRPEKLKPGRSFNK